MRQSVLAAQEAIGRRSIRNAIANIGYTGVLEALAAEAELECNRLSVDYQKRCYEAIHNAMLDARDKVVIASDRADAEERGEERLQP